ncbi:LacI family transcriptional regulator [Paenibacillus melissococcoides]|uniref:LacI family transcriptional regulator n=1 Tax=Paenibacillus melissococcoides TaxID=2912268 RepID=A0ABN8U2M0_9BACL|nr:MULTISPECIES: LacI family DNA-binding transcriptional regulator [Paenibacillus]MEB9897307.1 LacI family DNA-binding transcriptional regulator [Bacillus cereus]CAH8244453.1 LacI family transcriptional regulator [Paenibacillus melissococcoides]CAH8708036.1 LacI family transcriptional regulator [Paenibacillus melissococcoides]CAH8708742.1 LacI family transcriptional regulator [Paenibacillus melissococcoides]GIO81276.1 LacI family transcriptional regulator [Paenibacillus dendritiformis]
MATIKDVSRLAGVSVATVSRVLNQKGYVHEDTEKKVMNAIRELNYIPNDVARSLTKKSAKMLALIVPDITNPFFNELARAVEKVTQLYGYATILCNSDDTPANEKQYIHALKQKYIDGFILASDTLSAEEVRQLDVPVVTLDRTISDTIPTVASDNREGARQGVQYLLDRGCSKIAHIRGPQQLSIADERCQGYLDVVQEAAWFSPDLIVEGNFNLNQAAEAANRLLDRHPDIDGIFAGNDIMAMGALRAVQKRDIPVPDRMQIVGFDGISLGEMVYPELTTVAQSIYEMGLLAARMLIKMIERRPLDTMHYKLPVELIPRGTTR